MNDKKDIVDRLMLKSPLHNLTSYELVEAANEITRLRKERDNLGDWIDLTKLCKELDDRTVQVETLHKERDEARRMYCEKVSNASRQYGTSANDAAKHLGWDCYKENT
jgi:hypothetical protein